MKLNDVKPMMIMEGDEDMMSFRCVQDNISTRYKQGEIHTRNYLREVVVVTRKRTHITKTIFKQDDNKTDMEVKEKKRFSSEFIPRQAYQLTKKILYC